LLQHATEEIVQHCELAFAERRKRFFQDALDDLVGLAAQRVSLFGDDVMNRSSVGLDARNQASLDHARRKRSEGLIALKGALREIMERSARILREMPQRIPLHDADLQLGQCGIRLTVMTHLKSLHGKAQSADVCGHRVLVQLILAKINVFT
jgi:hypothetical protein